MSSCMYQFVCCNRTPLEMTETGLDWMIRNGDRGKHNHVPVEIPEDDLDMTFRDILSNVSS